ncbi:MAG: TonB-dependent receptor, partial [Gemmatimonadaceae bacterium]|nr:TonB-dependent receptor [Gemmatimonadaceae bacterium]
MSSLRSLVPPSTRAAHAPLASALSLLMTLAAPPMRAMTRPAACELPGARIIRATFEPGAARTGAWPEPLDRRISIEVGEVALRDALDSLDASAHVRLSYSAELVPLTRRVCLSFAQTALGDALLAVLAGAGVAPVVVGSDQVVLAPSRAAVGADAVPEMARSTTHLERVIVTGNATGGTERSSPFALTVVDGRALPPTSALPLAATFNGAMPGMWLWAQSPVTAVARYGSVRGASSFGVTTPKVYVDGIEVANPLMVTQLDPASIERIEVIRGPQGAALYGSDAISGVVQIVTRHDGADAEPPPTEVRVSAGSSTSSYAEGGILAQEHGITARRGSAARAASLGLSLSTLGAYTPGAAARQVMANGSLRHVGSQLILTGTARFQATNADVPASPVLRSSLALLPTTSTTALLGDSTPQRARQYTLGGTATFQQSDDWMHAFTAGIDGYRLSGLTASTMPLPSSTDSALRAARGGADRVSLRYNSTRRFGTPDSNGVLLTVGAEHSTARENTTGMGDHLAPRSDGRSPVQGPGGLTVYDNLADARDAGVTWWHNSGLLTQAQLAVNGSLFVTGGARLEHISGPATTPQFSVLPLLGTTWVTEQGPLTLKLRAAFGRGIQPARTVARGGTWMGGHGGRALTALAPEEQSGTEAGLDARWGGHLGLTVTRFDQRASGLVQPVAVLVYAGGGSGPRGYLSPKLLYQLQNVGAIDNRGWEMEAHSSLGSLAVSGTLTLVDSRVARLASGYLGDLREGDRMLEVPARTVGLNAVWASARWSLSGSVARAADWVNYDKVSLATAIAADSTGLLTPVGAALRAYWREYEGTTRMSLRTSYALRSHTWVSLSGENLLNRQLGEPDNVTVVPG